MIGRLSKRNKHDRMKTMSGYQNIKRWRERAKRRLKEAFGSRCGICGYNRYTGSLVFHHIDSNEKDHEINAARTIAWGRLVVEARKCVLLCANCHGEVHAGLATIEKCPRFDETFAEYREPIKPKICPCGKPVKKNGSKKYCSIRCAGLARSRAARTGRLW